MNCDESAAGEQLSAQGLARRGAMLEELDGVMRRRTARRGALKGGVVAVLMVGAGVLVWGRGPVRHGVTAIVVQRPAEGPRRALIEVVRTDAGICARLAAGGGIPRVTLIGDEELQSMLASMGRPTGLVKTAGRTVLASDVVAYERKPNTEPASERDGASS